MDYFSDRVPNETPQSIYFHFGYHDAKLETTKWVEPLVTCLMNKFSNCLTEEELNPNKYLFTTATLILEFCSERRDIFQRVCDHIDESRKNGKFDRFKFKQKDIKSKYSDIHESYTLMESKLRKIQSEKEQLEISNQRLVQQKSDLEKILIKQQDRLDGVNN